MTHPAATRPVDGERDLFPLALAGALGLHVVAIIILTFIGHGPPAPEYRPLAVMDFAHYDPEGGTPGGAFDEVAPEPAESPQPPEPAPPEPQAPPETEEAPPIIESVAEKAAPLPIIKPKVEKKPPPKPRPAASQAAAPSPAAGTESPALGGGPGQGRGGVGGGAGIGDPKAVRAYVTKMQRKLNRYKKYPPSARSNRQEGTVTVNFTVDRQGNVIASRLVKGSGHSVLDEEVMALLKRVSPFSPMPKEMTETTFNVTAPIQFSLR